MMTVTVMVTVTVIVTLRESESCNRKLVKIVDSENDSGNDRNRRRG